MTNEKKQTCAPDKSSSCGCCCQPIDPKLKKGMRFVTVAVVAVLIGLVLWNGGADTPAQKVVDSYNDPRAKHEMSLVRKDGKSFAISVEIAETQEQQRVGLMNRESVAEGEGMVFMYMEPQPVSFWMKDTLVPLDIFFVDAEHKIIKIVKNTTPKDTTPIPSEAPITAVLEMKAGEADRMGIAVGDTLK